MKKPIKNVSRASLSRAIQRTKQTLLFACVDAAAPPEKATKRPLNASNRVIHACPSEDRARPRLDKIDLIYPVILDMLFNILYYQK
jgi:hypothetical protein